MRTVSEKLRIKPFVILAVVVAGGFLLWLVAGKPIRDHWAREAEAKRARKESIRHATVIIKSLNLYAIDHEGASNCGF